MVQWICEDRATEPPSDRATERPSDRANTKLSLFENAALSTPVAWNCGCIRTWAQFWACSGWAAEGSSPKNFGTPMDEERSKGRAFIQGQEPWPHAGRATADCDAFLVVSRPATPPFGSFVYTFSASSRAESFVALAALAMATSRPLALSSSSPSAMLSRLGSATLAAPHRMWTGVRLRAGGMCASSIAPLVRGVRAAVSEAPTAKIGALDSEKLPVKALMEALDAAGRRGAEVIRAAVDKPRNIDYKGKADLVTDTDRNTELAILEVVREEFPDHLILGEEGGVSGDPTSEYLWCIDPLDGTTNFAHGYPCFAVSIAVLYRGRPLAATVVEFAGGPFAWVTRTFSASAGGGAFCNGQRIHVSSNDMVERSLLVTGFGYDHDKAWETNLDLFQYYTDVSRGVRRLGAAAVDCCHVALGIVDSYWEFRLKPWDMAAGVLIVEEAGGKVTRMDGGAFTVFDRSVIVSNGAIHDKLLEKIQPATEKLIADGLDFSQWLKPTGYMADI